jgi:two-component system, OmpR family, phosphate regulon sensor histidine kinase PhoR
MRRRSPTQLSLIAAIVGVAVLSPLIWFTDWFHSPLIELPVLAVLIFLVVRTTLGIGLYRRLTGIEAQLLEAIRHRYEPQVNPDQDIIRRIQASVDELIRLNQRELKQMKDLENFRREFVGDVSHELKTPLFAIQGFLDTLLDGAIDDKAVNRKFLKQALKNTSRLNKLVQDLIVISQIETGEVEMKPEEFRIYDVVLDVIDQLESKFNTKGRSVKATVKANGLEQTGVYADPDRIQQVLTNLIDNALEYGNPEGRIEVELTPLPHAGSVGVLRVAVQDDGPGIGAEHLPHIFSRFYRVDKSRSRDVGGTGLGLAIVKNLIEAHGQSIVASSQPGKGTRFEFTLPLVMR